MGSVVWDCATTTSQLRDHRIISMRRDILFGVAVCLLSVAVAKPFSDDYAAFFRSISKRSAQQAGYSRGGGGRGRGVSADSGYGGASAPVCRTEYKQECNTVN